MLSLLMLIGDRCNREDGVEDKSGWTWREIGWRVSYGIGCQSI